VHLLPIVFHDIRVAQLAQDVDLIYYLLPLSLLHVSVVHLLPDQGLPIPLPPDLGHGTIASYNENEA